MTKYPGYKWFIDSIVDVTNGGVTADRIRQKGHPYTDLDDHTQTALFLSFTAEQKEMVAALIEEARAGAIHDVMAFLDEALEDDRVALSALTEDVPESPFWTLHFDFIARLEGDSWPDDHERL